MRRKVRFAVLTGQMVPGYNVRCLKSAVMYTERFVSTSFQEGVIHKLVEKSLREYPNSDLNAILGLTVTAFHDGNTPCLIAYGNPARIEAVEGLKGDTHFDWYDVDI